MGKLSAPSTITSQPSPRMRSTFSEVSRSLKTLTVDVRVERLDRALRRLGLGIAQPLGRVDDLALEVGLVHDVVVHDAERAHSRGGQVERRGRAEPAGADQEDPRAEEPQLSFLADLGDQEVAAVAAALRRVERLGNLVLDSRCASSP